MFRPYMAIIRFYANKDFTIQIAWIALWCGDLTIKLLSNYIYYVQADTMLDWYVVSLRWYRGLILGCVVCHHGVANWMLSSLSSRSLLLWGCLWMALTGTVSPVGEHKVWEICSGYSGDMCGGVWEWYLHVWWSPCVSICCLLYM